MQERKIRFKALLTIIFITPFLTELLSGNLAPAVFFQPHIFLVTIITYGLAALVIRELSVRRNLNLEGIFILGLAYGIYNEGICAKTLLMAENVPMAVFSGYPLLFGINLPWAVFILPWHALHAVVYPILIVSLVFPSANNLSWLSSKYSILFMLIVIAAGIFGFFTFPNYSAAFIYLPVFIILIILLALLSGSKLIPKNLNLNLPAQKTGFKPAILGFSFIAYFIGLIILAGMKTAVFLSCAYAGLMIFIFYRIIKSARWPLEAWVLFALGNFTADALALLLGGFVKKSPETIIVAVIFITIFIIGILKVKRRL